MVEFSSMLGVTASELSGPSPWLQVNSGTAEPGAVSGREVSCCAQRQQQQSLTVLAFALATWQLWCRSNLQLHVCISAFEYHACMQISPYCAQAWAAQEAGQVRSLL